MSGNDWGVAAVGAVGAIIGGFVGGFTPQFVAWFFRPKLQIDYKDDENNKVTVEEVRTTDGKVGEYIYVRVRVQNNGRLRAKGSQVFIAALHELRADGSLHTVMKDSKVLQWAGGSKLPLDVPQGVEFYADLLKISKDAPGWGMIFGLFNNQLKLQLYPGTYQFTLMVSGDNAAPQKCSINVEYKQDWNTLRAWQVF